jgi:hypothetical protein
MTWHQFDGVIEPMLWGQATYTVIRVPPDVVACLAGRGSRRVEGFVEEIAVNLALTTTPVIDGTFLWAGRSLLRKLAADAGDPVRVRLRAADPGNVPVPDDVQAALAGADCVERWEQLTPGKRRGLLARVDSAATETTRARRIAELIDVVS